MSAIKNDSQSKAPGGDRAVGTNTTLLVFLAVASLNVVKSVLQHWLPKPWAMSIAMSVGYGAFVIIWGRNRPRGGMLKLGILVFLAALADLIAHLGWPTPVTWGAVGFILLLILPVLWSISNSMSKKPAV